MGFRVWVWGLGLRVRGLGFGVWGLGLPVAPGKFGHKHKSKKRREVGHARHPEVIASRSELLSLHCLRQPLLLALLPACAGSQFIMRQDCSAYAAEPLRTAGLLEAAHQYSLQDMCGSACSPSPLYSLSRRDSFRTYSDYQIAGLGTSAQLCNR